MTGHLSVALITLLFLVSTGIKIKAVESNGNFNNNSDPGSSITNWSSGWPSGGVDGWNYVGRVSSSSAVYLGNGWVITAAHVGAGDFTLNGTVYSLISGTATSLTGGDIDAVLFKVASPPSLPALTIRYLPPVPFTGQSGASQVALIGYGGGSETWGFNTVNSIDQSTEIQGHLSTDFSTTTGTFTIGTMSITNPAVVGGGDSGGGDFIYNAATSGWELAGINEATEGGNESYFIQLSAYAQQIVDIAGLSVSPVILNQPVGNSVNAGTPVSFSVGVYGSDPFSYQWSKNGTNISGATSGTYTLSSTSLTDAGVYTVLVVNASGTITSTNATLAVSSLTIAPLNPSVVITLGQPVTFSASATGAGPFTYQWMKDGTAISGATSSSYTISSVSAGDQAGYTVAVSNTFGTVTSTSSELIPVVSQQQVYLGQTASFTVSPAGDGPFTYQWEFAGTTISGATSATYSIANTTDTSTGIYSVIVTSSAGSTTSNFGLVVNTPEDSPTMPPWALLSLAILLGWFAAVNLVRSPKAASSLPHVSSRS